MGTRSMLYWKGRVITRSAPRENCTTRSSVCMYDKLVRCFWHIVTKQRHYTRYVFSSHYRDKLSYLLSFLVWCPVYRLMKKIVDKSSVFIPRQRFNLDSFNASMYAHITQETIDQLRRTTFIDWNTRSGWKEIFYSFYPILIIPNTMDSDPEQIYFKVSRYSSVIDK